MTAGMIKVPSIMPLRVPLGGTARKNMINTNTPIEIRSETRDTLIYYTINGMKPEPFKQIGIKCTYKYNRPFVLGPGKRVVKAMATSSDGTRESSIVTKTFLVGEPDVELREDISEFDQSMTLSNGNLKESSGTLLGQIIENYKEPKLKTSDAWGIQGNSKRLQTSTPNDWEDVKGADYRKPRTEPRFTMSRFGSNQATVDTLDQSVSQVNGELREKQSPSNKTQLSRIQQQTDFLKCIYCMAPRPSDPYARFCAECGSPIPPLPSSRLPPPEGGQLGMCVSCHSMVPLNTPNCIICEVPLSPQRQPQATKKLAHKLMCTVCGTGNPPDLTVCVTCEARLPYNAKQIFTGTSAPPVPKDSISCIMTCSKCSRINSSDARFCDWCGAKPQPYQSPLICSQCHASNNAFSRFCNSCGCGIEPPPRISQQSSGSVIGTIVERGSIHKMISRSDSATWVPVSVPATPAEMADKATSTVGLFYPSAATIQSQIELETQERSRLEASRDRRPALTAVSPGKGFWRQQMDHVCSHIRAHAQNDPDFRSTIGEPRLGKIITATIHEDLNGEEVILSFTFARRDGKEFWKAKSKALASSLKALNLDRSVSGSREDIRAKKKPIQNGLKTTAKGKKQKRAGKDNNKDKLSDEDKLLLKEIGPKGEGDEEEVQKLLDEGANPESVSADGAPAIIVATVNKHADVIPLLVNAGAKLNTKNESKGNTALHEAVLLGANGIKCIDVLIGLGARTNVANDAGRSAYDLAMETGVESVAQRFTANMGDEMLQKLTKPKKVTLVEEDDF